MPHPEIKAPETSFMDKCNMFIRFQHISSGESVKFYGILDSFSDSYTSTWNEQSAYGRMDPISTFQKTSRRISLAWKVLSEDDDVGVLNMRDVSKLINFLYPSYGGITNSASTITAAPLLRLKFNNLVTNASNSKIAPGLTAEDDGLVGYINGGLTVNTNMESGFLTPEPGILIPRTISLKIDFTVLHTHKLGWAGRRSRTSGLFPFKTGGRFTDRVTGPGTGDGRKGRGGIRGGRGSNFKGAKSGRDDISPDVLDALKMTEDERLAATENLEQGINVEEAQSDRDKAAGSSRGSVFGQRTLSESDNPEQEEHWNNVI